MIEWIIVGVLVLLAIIGFVIASAWYRIVSPSEAHLVVMPNGKNMVCSPDPNVSTINNDRSKGKTSYFAIPEWIPWIGRSIRIMDVTIKELLITQETYEKNQARYMVKSSTKYKIINVTRAAETFISNGELAKQLEEVVLASVRAITIKYDVTEARANKTLMGEEISNEVTDDLKGWGLELINFQLVDFQDTKDSSIISDISKRREVEISSQTRQENAEKIKNARIKEAESEENAKKRELEKDEKIGKRDKEKEKVIFEAARLTKEKELEVEKVQQVKTAQILKEKARVEAEQKKEVEEIIKVQKKLEGEGDRAKAEEQAKGTAAPIREEGFAHAEAKEKLQQALNKFGDNAIRALTAELIVEKEKVVGVATAEALTKADLKVLAGGSTEGFDLGKLVASVRNADDETSSGILNRMARPNDLGLTALQLRQMADNKEKKEKTKKPIDKLKDTIEESIDELKDKVTKRPAFNDKPRHRRE